MIFKLFKFIIVGFSGLFIDFGLTVICKEKLSLNKKDKLNYHISYKSNNEDIDNYEQVKLNTKTLMLYSKNK